MPFSATSLKDKCFGRGCLCPNRPISAHEPGGNAIKRQRASGRSVPASFRGSYLIARRNLHPPPELKQGHLISSRDGGTFCCQGHRLGNRQLDFCLLHRSPHLTTEATGYQQMVKPTRSDGFHRVRVRAKVQGSYDVTGHRQSKLF